MIRTISRRIGLRALIALSVFSMAGCNGCTTPPPAPTLLSLEIPNTAFGAGFSGVTPAIAASSSGPATYFVLPLLTTTPPIARAVLSTPYPSDLVVDATSQGVMVSLPQIASGASGPATGYFQVVSVTPNDPATWTITIRYPDTFQNSRSISTAIAYVKGGQTSAQLTFLMNFRGSRVTVRRVTENNDGRILSTPPGIDCPGTCSADFLDSTTNVILTQGVTSNSTEFIGWTGNCAGTGNCTLSLLAPGGNVIPMNAGVTATFRIHTSNTAIPPAMSCPAAAFLPGLRWVAQPHCGSPPPLGATLQCDTQGYFCCGVSDPNGSQRCSGRKETAATCAADGMGVFGSNLTLHPGGCYEPNP